MYSCAKKMRTEEVVMCRDALQDTDLEPTTLRNCVKDTKSQTLCSSIVQSFLALIHHHHPPLGLPIVRSSESVLRNLSNDRYSDVGRELVIYHFLLLVVNVVIRRLAVVNTNAMSLAPYDQLRFQRLAGVAR